MIGYHIRQLNGKAVSFGINDAIICPDTLQNRTVMLQTHGQHLGSDQILRQGDLASMSDFIAAEAGKDGLHKALQLVSTLQMTLDLNHLINTFSTEINSLVPHKSIAFRNKVQNINIRFGGAARHSCTYQLVTTEQTLGQLTITRNKKFTSNETVMLEYLLCSLVYPLRNAIMYKNALIAALKDPLTGVNNRNAMNTSMIREIELSRRHGSSLSLIALDIDFLKKINDGFGHAAGDCAIKAVASAVSDCIRSSDMLFRFGGEEFLVLLSNTGKKGALMLAERIRHTIKSLECKYGEFTLPLTASLGVACYAMRDNSETLFKKADMALYRAKSDGRNCVRFTEQGS